MKNHPIVDTMIPLDGGQATQAHDCHDYGAFRSSEEAILNFTLDFDVNVEYEEEIQPDFNGLFDSLPTDFNVDFDFVFDGTGTDNKNKNTNTTTTTTTTNTNFNTHYIKKPAHLNMEEKEEEIMIMKKKSATKQPVKLCLGLVSNLAEIKRINKQRAFEEKERLRKARVQRYLQKRKRKSWCTGKRILYPGRQQQSLNRSRVLGRFVKAKKAK
jgi:hypothetical protein